MGEITNCGKNSMFVQE